MEDSLKLHGWLDLCQDTYHLPDVFGGKYYACECGRIKGVTLVNSPGFIRNMRKSLHWRVFKRFCAWCGHNANAKKKVKSND